MYRWLLKISKKGDSIVSLGDLFHCLVICMVKKSISWCSKDLLCVLVFACCLWVPLKRYWLVVSYLYLVQDKQPRYLIFSLHITGVPVPLSSFWYYNGPPLVAPSFSCKEEPSTGPCNPGVTSIALNRGEGLPSSTCWQHLLTQSLLAFFATRVHC